MKAQSEVKSILIFVAENPSLDLFSSHSGRRCVFKTSQFPVHTLFAETEEEPDLKIDQHVQRMSLGEVLELMRRGYE